MPACTSGSAANGDPAGGPAGRRHDGHPLESATPAARSLWPFRALQPPSRLLDVRAQALPGTPPVSGSDLPLHRLVPQPVESGMLGGELSRSRPFVGRAGSADAVITRSRPLQPPGRCGGAWPASSCRWRYIEHIRSGLARSGARYWLVPADAGMTGYRLSWARAAWVLTIGICRLPAVTASFPASAPGQPRPARRRAGPGHRGPRASRHRHAPACAARADPA